MHDATLLQLFNDDIATAQQLLQLIDSEFQALTVRDLPALDGILGAKQPLLALLHQHGGERHRVLSKLNLSPDRQGLQTLASASSLGPQLLASADQLGELLGQCQTGNLRNGRLIRANQASVGSVLGILRGGETPSLYDSGGGAARIAQQRPLSQA